MAQTIAEIEDISSISPMMQKYIETKKKYKDCILFYRLGDFYEMFFEDAITVSRELEITLTGKECGQKGLQWQEFHIMPQKTMLQD